MVKKWLKEYIDINKKDILFIISFLILGIVIGVCFYIFSSTEVKDIAIQNVKQVFDLSKNENYLKTNIILNGIKADVILIVVLGILSVTLFGRWITYGIVILKGISLSLYTILLFNIFGGLWGILVTFLLVILVNIIYIPAFIFIVVSFLDINFSVFKFKIGKINISTVYKVIFSVIITLLIMLSSTVVEQVSSSIVLNIYNKI